MSSGAKARLEIAPSVAGLLSDHANDWIVIDADVSEEETVGELLGQLTTRFANAAKVVYDPDTQVAGSEILVVLNDCLLQFPEAAGARLKEGDKLTIIPEFFGGQEARS